MNNHRAERRREHRIQVNHRALVRFGSKSSWLCTIRDFCSQGMYLQGDGAELGRAIGVDELPPSGARLEVHFRGRTSEGERRLVKLAGIAVRRMEDAIGVRFPAGIPGEVQQLLLHTSQQAAAARSSAQDTTGGDARARNEPLAGGVRQQIARDCATAVSGWLQRFIRDYLGLLQTELDECVRRATSLTERDAFTHAISSIGACSAGVQKEFPASIARLLQNLQVRAEARSETAKVSQGSATGSEFGLFDNLELSMVDKDRFERWLVVAETITVLEREFWQELFVLQDWLGLLHPEWQSKHHLPVGPAVLARALNDALDRAALEEIAFRQAILTFRQLAAGELRQFYRKFIAYLDRSSHFPSVKEIVARSVKKGVAGAAVESTAGSAAGATQTAGLAPATPAADAEQAVVTGRVRRRSPPCAEVSSAAAVEDGGEVIPLTTSRTGSSVARGGAAESAVRVDADQPLPGLSQVSAILRLANRRQRPASGRAAGHEDVVSDPVDTGTLVGMLDLLEKARQRRADTPGPVRLRQDLTDTWLALHRQTPEFGVDAAATLDLVDYLVELIEQDETTSQVMRDWVRRLAVTLGKESLCRGPLLDRDPSEQHALHLLNQLEVLDAAAENTVRSEDPEVETVLTKLVHEWDGNRDVFMDAVAQLLPRVERQRQRTERNLERVAQQSLGRSRLRKARRGVLQLLTGLFEGRRIPRGLLELVNPHWRNVLVTIGLKADSSSVEWQQQVRLLRTVTQRCLSPGGVRPADDGIGTADLMECLRQALATGGVPVQGLIDRIAHVLEGGQADDDDVVVAPGTLAALFGWSDVSSVPDPVSPATEERERERWLECLGQARSMRTGAVVRFAAPEQDGRNPGVELLAWKDPDGSSYTFANRRGLWQRDLSLAELVTLLHSRRATLLEQHDAPLLDRVTQRLMQRIHGRITADSQQDELTSLGNRAAFERALERALHESRLGRGEHAVLQIDVDRFQLLNMSHGFETGDLVLKEIARVARRIIGERKVQLARIGGDEFAVVLFDAGISEAEALADELIAGFRKISVRAEGRTASFSTTVGVVPVDPHASGIPMLLAHMASACRAGKSAGGDRSFVFTVDDAALKEQHELMQLAGDIEKYLAEGRIRLNCQLIKPAVAGEGRFAHYEILMTCDDDNGQPGSPVRFIQAAERFGKMNIVDRHVVREVLHWMGRHPEALETISGFSINLSGQSITHPEFLGFVLDEFESSGALPGKVCFEITETAAVGNLGQAIEFMEKCRMMGCRFSLDDFGAGMASFGYLRSLPVDYLKIDGSFVKNMVTDESDQAVVRSINEIGHFLGKLTVAEYVHDEATQRLAREIGVDYLQGWEVEKPKPLHSLLDVSTDRMSAAS